MSQDDESEVLSTRARENQPCDDRTNPSQPPEPPQHGPNSKGLMQNHMVRTKQEFGNGKTVALVYEEKTDLTALDEPERRPRNWSKKEEISEPNP